MARLAAAPLATPPLGRFDGRVFYEHIPTRKQQWRKPEELAGLEEVDALTIS